ncbi:MAG: tetratricopeptide repeat protein, partial [Planctomycetota bacterium]
MHSRSLPVLAGLAIASCFAATLPRSAHAQLGSVVPPRSHQIAIEMLYSGEYRRAERAFTSDLRGAIKIGQTRWIDSICSHAMLGETYYQQGRTEEALYQFDQACSRFLAYPNWMTRVKFQQAPRADAGLRRRGSPWGPSSRQVTYAALPDTFLVSRGRIDNSQQANTGGVVQAAQFW